MAQILPVVPSAPAPKRPSAEPSPAKELVHPEVKPNRDLDGLIAGISMFAKESAEQPEAPTQTERSAKFRKILELLSK
jgi:hypothetical protein